MSDPSRISRIAVLGPPHALWPVIAMLAKSVPDYIELIAAEDLHGDSGPAADTLPLGHAFFQAIGVTSEDLIHNCNARLGLGTNLRGWQGEGSEFFSAPSGTLPMINGVAIHDIMLRAATLYDQREKFAYLFHPFRFAARAAMAGKFALRSDDPQSPLTMLGPTVQYERALFTQMLKARLGDSVRVYRDEIAKADVCDDRQCIRSVTLSAGPDITADLYIDLGGGLSKFLKLNRTSLSDYLPFDRYVSQINSEQSSGSHTSALALPGSVDINTPLARGHALDQIYNSTVTDGQGGQVFAAYHSNAPWTGNVLRMGASSSCLGPYRSADTRVLFEETLQLASFIPDMTRMDCEAAAYNQKQLDAFEEVRDFVLLPFVLNVRDDGVWPGIRDKALPESLQIRINQFKSRGRFVTFESEMVDKQTWIDMMIGFGLVPDRFDPRAEALDMARLAPTFKAMTQAFTQEIAAMPES